MRFRFCGDLDCPDWVLAEINTLSKMSSVKVKILCQIVAKSLTGNELDVEKAKKLVLDAKLDLGDMKACISALSSIFGSSARYAVEEDVLNNELQQLGLPKEHATGLCKVYSEHLSAFTEDLEKHSMRTSTLDDVNCSIRGLETHKIELNLKINDKIRDVTSSDVITMTSEQLALLLTVSLSELLHSPILGHSASRLSYFAGRPPNDASTFPSPPCCCGRNLKSAREEMKCLPG